MHTELDSALANLRDLAHGIYPTILEVDGLPAALRDAARRAPIATQVDCDATGRYAAAVETAVYFCCVEALQNVAKHAGEGAHAQISLTQRNGVLSLEVSNNGRGFESSASSGNAGLQSMADRIGALGGTLEIDSIPGTGTTIVVTIPLAGLRTRRANTSARAPPGFRNAARR